VGKHAVATDDSEIPTPVLDRTADAWREKTWSQPAYLWPTTSPYVLTYSTRARSAVIVLLGADVALMVSSIVASTFAGSAAFGDVVWSALLFGTPGLALGLRLASRAPRFSKFIFVLFVAIGWLVVGIEGIALASGTFGASTGPIAALFIGELAYLVAFTMVWKKVGTVAAERMRRRSLIAVAHSSVPPAILQSRVHGVPGRGLVDGIEKFGENNVSLGFLGEQITAALLAELLVIPGVQIIHGLRFPGTKTSDVDHAVICGNKVALIDSKLWASGHYELDKFGRILKDGRMSKRHNSHHATAVERMTAKFPQAQFKGWIVVHPQDTKGTTASTADLNASTQLVTAGPMMKDVGNWLADPGDTVDLFVMRDLIAERNW
jgi:Nuclease-related domain